MSDLSNYVLCNACFAKRPSQEEKACCHGCDHGVCVECGGPYGGEVKDWGHCLGTYDPKRTEKK